MLLEDTELSCAAGLPQGEDKKITRYFRLSFSLLPHKYDGLFKVPLLSVNSCPAVQLTPAGSTLSSASVFCFLGDPGTCVETSESSEVAGWVLTCFSC